MLRGLDFDIAPAAACPRRLRQNLKLSLPAPPEQPPSLTAAACRDQHRGEALPAQPVKKSGPLLRMAEIVKTQLKGPGRFEPETQLGDHLARRTRGDYSTNLILSERPFQEVPLAK